MGIRMYYTRLPQARLDSVRREAAAWKALQYDVDELYEASDHWKVYGGTEELGFGELDKAYSPLYFFFDPVRRAVRYDSTEPSTLGGAAIWAWHAMAPELFDDDDYAARYNTAKEVAEIAAWLRTVGMRDFQAMCAEHAPALARLGEFAGLVDREYLCQRFEILCAFYGEAARHNHAVIAQLN